MAMLLSVASTGGRSSHSGRGSAVVPQFHRVGALLATGTLALAVSMLGGSPAAADPKLRAMAVGAAAKPVAKSARQDEGDKSPAVARPLTDPPAQLSYSERAKAFQERADRILAENGESRNGDEDVEAAWDAGGARKPASGTNQAGQPEKARPQTASIQCVAGCD